MSTMPTSKPACNPNDSDDNENDATGIYRTITRCPLATTEIAAVRTSAPSAAHSAPDAKRARLIALEVQRRFALEERYFALNGELDAQKQDNGRLRSDLQRLYDQERKLRYQGRIAQCAHWVWSCPQVSLMPSRMRSSKR